MEVVGQRIERDRAVLACRVAVPDRWCRRCGAEGVVRDSVVRRLAHAPFGWRPTTLHVTLARYRCGDCAHVWREDMERHEAFLNLAVVKGHRRALVAASVSKLRAA